METLVPGVLEMGGLCKILIVDDEMLVRQGLRHHLDWERYGYQIVGEAANGKEALEMIERLQPHIVITDIVMPVMDGEELTRLIKSLYPQIEVIVLSSYGEFQYVRSTFQSGVADYILKPKLGTDELLQVLHHTVRKIPGLELHLPTRVQDKGDTTIGYEIDEHMLDRMLNRLLAGYDPDPKPDESVDEGRNGGYETVMKKYLPYDRFRLICAELDRITTDPHRFAKSLAEQVIAYYRDLAYPTMWRILDDTDDGHHRLIMLVNLPDEYDVKLMEDLREFIEVRSTRKLEVVWAVSDRFAELRTLPDIYRGEVLKLLSYSFYLPDRGLMLSSELPSVPEAPAWDMQQLTMDIRNRQLTVACNRVREYADQAIRYYVMPPIELKSQFGNAMFNIGLELLAFSRDNPAVGKLDEAKFTYFRMIDEASDVREAVTALEAYLKEVERIGISSRVEDSKMKQLLAFIEEHYHEPLRLNTLSEHFHFHPSYLSGYFSAHHQEGFSEYLNRVRITKACELLRDDQLPISEISAKVGYSDHSYFTRVFKKYIGQSPSQYRRQHLGGPDMRNSP